MAQGRCLCGACRFTAEPAADHAEVCHCSKCRQWSGGMFIGVTVAASLSFAEGAPVKSYESSDWGRRLFCAECGSTLAWAMADGTMAMVSIHALEGAEELAVTHEIFIDEKPAGYALAGETKKSTGAEVFAAFEAGQGET